jgi:osmotically inducible protein OsmC
MKRKANAIWKGSTKEGVGSLTGPSGVLDKTPYSFKARFENEEGKLGTNPEELIAAAHAGCFSMALSVALGEEGYEADEINTDAIVELEKTDGGFEITSIELQLSAKVPGIDESKFKELANGAKEGCPISKALKSVPINLVLDFKS